MLNPRWDKVYDPKDLDDYDKLMGTAPPVQYPFQHQILYRLLGKYYRTNKGNQLHPENPRHLTAFFEMVQRTMEELRRQVALKEDFEERQRNEQWEKQREIDEDPIDRLLREDEIKRNATLTRISLREEVDLGRFWINPNGEILKPLKNKTHIEWIRSNPQLLSDEEKSSIDDGDFLKKLLSDGWIRISGAYIQVNSEADLDRVAKFLKGHVFSAEYDYPVVLFMSSDSEGKSTTIKDIISKYGDEERFEMQANSSSDKILLPKKHIKEDLREFNELQDKIEDMKNEDKDALKNSSLSLISFRKSASNVPNPLRQNYDYSAEMGGPEWQNRVKNFEKKKESAGGTTSCGIQKQKN